MMAHKVKHFTEHIPKAFPSGASLILDAEVLMVDINTSKPLPFGTLGIHKGGGFKDAVPCLFVFDILFYNGESWMEKPLKERRHLLESQLVEVRTFLKEYQKHVIAVFIFNLLRLVTVSSCQS